MNRGLKKIFPMGRSQAGWPPLFFFIGEIDAVGRK